MSDQQAYETTKEAVRAMQDSLAVRPVMPLENFIHEALRLYHWALEDRSALERAGMNWQLAEALRTRSAALRHAQGLWSRERFISEEAQKAWVACSPEAYDLRNILLHTYRFAFRRRPDLLRVVDIIAEGSSHADMLQDLKDLTMAGRRNADLLAAINFDTALLDRSESLAEELGRVYAEARNDRLACRQAKLIRDKIATLLKQSVDEVRAYGQYLFWRDAERRAGYASDYFRNQGPSGGPPAGKEFVARVEEEQQPEPVQELPD